MGPTDSMFLLVESREHPMHVGGLQLFSPPEDAGPGWVADELLPVLRPPGPIHPRFRLRPALPVGTVGNVLWREDDEIDLDHHVRPSAVPAPGRLRELFELTSRWQGSLLDRYRPLWESYVVEGLEGGRVAVFSKVHHALLDGVSALQLMQRACSPDPDARDCVPAYAAPETSVVPKESGPTPGPLSPSTLARGGREVVQELATIGPRALQVGWRSLRDPDLATAFDAPRTILNGRVGAARRFVAQTFERDRFRVISKAADVSFNDVVLAACSGALRAYLDELGALPDRSLTAMCPVDLRDDLAVVGGNSVGAIIATLATDTPDPFVRLETIHASTTAAKATMRQLSPLQTLLMSGLNIAGLGLASVPGYLDLSGPPFNVVISNVPGPRKQLWFNGAHLDGTYPASIAYDGLAVNITLVTYDDQVDFGITACRRSAPHVQRIIRHLEDSLAELEAAV
ncbi:wax ester/triacylglycerol synthase family O-acyltransferase [Luteipulveratus sp. YIM 133132]|uniref:WS/DGAT/MGAT family O-acyltransferase n=1 Tax=Luteipulveratus flavus TaxID=3031728 RepID=UPI0023B17B6F|nr:wax ester/triacylglycerol synthase family O-acyltransferase [Luteipulveratus sp. YIM 133132]MDE9365289.1 wax ester/triacylglycerol synthase family O-acyltransferase [Luteipulveratus sp. YIM 133132]